eukprot:3023327-Amphidinium_carterae.1
MAASWRGGHTSGSDRAQGLREGHEKEPGTRRTFRQSRSRSSGKKRLTKQVSFAEQKRESQRSWRDPTHSTRASRE